MNYINLTPHAIHLNDGREFLPSGQIARVSVDYSEIINDITTQVYGEVMNLPEPSSDTMYIVSGLVLSAIAGQRDDVVAPATGHPSTMRNEEGQIVSVPCFTR